MAFKINIGDKSGKTYKLEVEAPFLIDKELGSTFNGKELREDLEGYEFEITGASDKAGFTAMKEVPGANLKGALLKYGKGMHKKPKREGKKPRHDHKPKGLKLRKKVRGKLLSEAIVQINLKPTKTGKKTLKDIFEPKEEAKTEEKPAEAPAQ